LVAGFTLYIGWRKPALLVKYLSVHRDYEMNSS
jgi:hypothetical protein